MSHLYNHIQKHTDAPVMQLERKESTSSSKDNSTVSELTLEHALKPSSGTLLPDEELSSEQDVMPEDMLKSDPREKIEQVLKDDLREGGNLKDDPGGEEVSVYSEEQAGMPPEPASVVASEAPSEIPSEENASTVMSGFVSTGAGTLESMQYSEQESVVDQELAKVDAYVLDESEKSGVKAVSVPDNDEEETSRKYWWYIGGAVIIVIAAIVVAVVIVLTTRDSGDGSSSSSNLGQQPAGFDAKTLSPITLILPSNPPSSLRPTTLDPSGLPPTTSMPSTALPTTATPSTLPGATAAPTEVFLAGVAFDGGEALRTFGTPQNRALQWLLGNEGLNSFSTYNTLQRYALATFFYSTGGETEWFTNDGWLTDDSVCDWNNSVVAEARCVDESNLMALNVRANGLGGKIPSEFAHASQMSGFILSQNRMNGTVPVEIFTKLTNLTWFDVYLNEFSGTIPIEIGLATDLQYLDIDTNRFSGTIPTEIGRLQSVKIVWLNNNNLRGTIPTEMAQMKALEHLYLRGNELTGTVPEEICIQTNVSIKVTCGFACSCCANDCSTASPTRSPVTLGLGAEDLRTLLASVLLDGGVALNTLDTPQETAFQWLASSLSLDSWSDKQLIERYALAVFYFSTNGDRWTKNDSWLSDDDICVWFGTNGTGCNQGLFRSLVLENNNLVGTLPIELVQIDTLHNFDFKNNKLISTIPTEYFTRLQLRTLDLYNNEFSGVISPELGLQRFMTAIDFDSNQFEGTIPTQIGQLQDLNTMWLNNNLLMGSIPTELAQMENIKNIYFTGNSLSGDVPLGICASVFLQNLEANCDMACACCTNDCGEGSTRPPRSPSVAPTASPLATAAPSSTNFARITTLLSSVSFDGGVALSRPGTPQNQAYIWLMSSLSADTLSDERLVQRYALATFYYSTNGPTWNMLGAWVTDADECLWYTSEEGEPVCTGDTINQIDLDNNNLVGTIPPELALLSNIRLLDFFNNFLTGSLPTELGLLTNLETVFDVDSNLLTGLLPTELSSLSKLSTFWLKKNLFTGTVPSEYGNMVNLQNLYLHENKLSGTMPSEICALNLTNLQVDCATFQCSCCKPTCDSSMPAGFADLLTIMSLVSPDKGASLLVKGSPQREALFWLAGNSGLSGYETQQLIQRYAMATLYYSTGGANWTNQEGWLTNASECTWFNNLTIPPCDSNSELRFLSLERNSLEGTIPAEVGLLGNSLDVLDFSENRITSTLPTEFGLLSAVSWLDVDTNFLSGTIPTEIGKMTNVSTLRVHNNDLTGTIPSEIGLLLNLDTLDVAINDLIGTLPTELGLLTRLTFLSAYVNSKLTGSVPTELVLLKDLSAFFIDGTAMTGELPAGFCDTEMVRDIWGDCLEIVCDCCTTCCEDTIELQICEINLGQG